jgi:hypothetical protein
MKKTSVIMAAILVASILFSGMAFGLEPPEGPMKALEPRHQLGPQEPPMPYGMLLLVKCLETNVLGELTGLTQENVRQLLISSPPPAILDAYGVPVETFIAAMDKQTTKLINQAAAGGVINKKQAEDILKRMARKPAIPHEG